MIPGGSTRLVRGAVPAQVHAAVGVGICGQPARLGRVRAQAPGGQRAESPTHARGPGRLLGSRNSQNQHAVPERSAYISVRQGLALPHGLQAVSSIKAEPVLARGRRPVVFASMSSWVGPRRGRVPRVLVAACRSRVRRVTPTPSPRSRTPRETTRRAT